MEDIRRNTSVDNISYLPYNDEYQVDNKFKVKLYSYQRNLYKR